MNEFLRVTLASPQAIRRVRPDKVMVDETKPSHAYSTPTKSRPRSIAGQYDTPRTPGRLEALKNIIAEAKAHEGQGELQEALHCYQSASIMIPNEPRIMARIDKLEGMLQEQSLSTLKASARSGRRKDRVLQDVGNLLSDDEGQEDDAHMLHLCIRGMNIRSATTPMRTHTTSGTPTKMSSPVWTPTVTPSKRSEGAWSQIRDESTYTATACPSECGSDGSADADGENTTPLRLTECEDVRAGRDLRPQAGGSCERPGWSPCKGADGLTRLNKEMRSALEAQIVDLMNHSDREGLMNLHGIGARRSQLILDARSEKPFNKLEDLSRIGLYDKQIIKLAKQNMLERLDVSTP